MGRPKIYVFGPSMLDTIETGDVFRKGHRTLVCTGRIYHDDLSVSHRFDVTGGRKDFTVIHESTLAAPGARGYRRIYKTPRKIVLTEATLEELNGTS